MKESKPHKMRWRNERENKVSHNLLAVSYLHKLQTSCNTISSTLAIRSVPLHIQQGDVIKSFNNAAAFKLLRQIARIAHSLLQNEKRMITKGILETDKRQLYKSNEYGKNSRSGDFLSDKRKNLNNFKLLKITKHMTICTAQWSLYVPHSGQYMYRTAVTICTAQWSLYVPPV